MEQATTRAAHLSGKVDAGLDLVVDDASHMLSETLSSFEQFFPLLRPGGLYIIEDWSWGQWISLPDVLVRCIEYEPSPFAVGLLEAVGSMDGRLLGDRLEMAIARVTVLPDLLVVERGTKPLEIGRFSLSAEWSTHAGRKPLSHRVCGLANRGKLT